MKAVSLQSSAAILLISILAACSNAPEKQLHTTCMDIPPQPQMIENSRIGEIMRDYEYLRAQPATELAKEYKKVSQDFMQTESDSNRVRLAMLLSLPDTPFHDTSAAINLLNNWPIDENLTHQALHGFANFLSAMLTQQRKSNNAVNDLAKKLKDEQRHTEILQNKIDSITDMEKELLNRNAR